MVSWVEKRVGFLAQFPYFRRFSRAQLTYLLVSVFDDIGVYGKLMMSSSECHKSHEESSLGLWDTALRIEATRVIFVVRSHLPIKIPAKPEKLLAIQELHVVVEGTLFLKDSNLQTNS